MIFVDTSVNGLYSEDSPNEYNYGCAEKTMKKKEKTWPKVIPYSH